MTALTHRQELTWSMLTAKALQSGGVISQHLGKTPNVLVRYQWPAIKAAASPPAVARTRPGRIVLATKKRLSRVVRRARAALADQRIRMSAP